VLAAARPSIDGGAVTVHQARTLRGSPAIPGDKSISHRALMLALLAEGRSHISGASGGADVRSTAGIVAALGAGVEEGPTASGGVSYVVTAGGLEGIRRPDAVLDCGNAGTALRLFAGILAGRPLTVVLDGDASLRARPVARIIEPLRSMGAVLRARRHDSLPPLTVIGRPPLRALDWTVAVPSAQVKSAILLAGLQADGVTRIREPIATRDHTERMLRDRGVRVTSRHGSGGWTVEIEGGQQVTATDQQVPGDASAAAFWLVAAAIHPDAELTLGGVGMNPTRRAAIDILRTMGAEIEETAVGGGDMAADDGSGPRGEPLANLRARSSELRAADLSPADTAAAIDEVPILALAASQAHGRTVIRGAGELRHKESDRIGGIVEGLRALGAAVAVEGDDLVIDGPVALHGAVVDSLGDHRLAMTFAIAGLIASGSTTIRGADCAAISDPGFFAELERIPA
jgi:3-phosphoshikimate 1-carboxyvinyltransferase